MTLLIGLVFGGSIGAGMALIAIGTLGTEDRPAHRHPRRNLPDLGRLTLRVAACVAAGLVTFALTRWVAGMLIGAIVVALAPSLIGAKARRDAVIDRTEAVASWAEMLRDTMAASAGLQAAITASAAVAPAPIRDEVRRLATSIQREDLEVALRDFAAAVDDPAADIVVVALIVAATRQARNVGEVLQKAAAAARASASMRHSVEAGRARSYTSARIIVIVTIGMSGFIAVFNRSYLAPFDAAVGQLVLMVIGALLGLGLWSLSRMAKIDAGSRVLVHPGNVR